MDLLKNAPSARQKLLIARLISRVTEPLIWVPLMIWLVLRQVNLSAYERRVYYPVLLFFIFVIPFGYFIYLVSIKKVFDPDISERSNRVSLTLKSMVSFALAVFLTFFMARELFIITGAVFLSTLSLVLITTRWKISFHSGLNTLAFCTVNYLYNWRLWWLFLLLIPIGWARLALQKHNLAQLIAGMLISAAIFLIVTGSF